VKSEDLFHLNEEMIKERIEKLMDVTLDASQTDEAAQQAQGDVIKSI